MATIPTPNGLTDLAEKYEFGDSRERRRCFDKLREQAGEAVKLIERQKAAIERLTNAESAKTAAGPSDDIVDRLRKAAGLA